MNAETQIKTVRRKVVWGTRIRTALVLGILLATSCSQSIRTGQASSYLVITSLTGGLTTTAPLSPTSSPTPGPSSPMLDRRPSRCS